MDPRLRIACAHRKARLRVQTMRPADLAGEMQLHHLFGAALLDAAARRRWQPLRQLIHVVLDRDEMLFTKLLHGVAHNLVRLEGAHALVDDAVACRAASAGRVIKQCDASVVVVAARGDGGRSGHDDFVGRQHKGGVDGQSHDRLLLLGGG